MTMMFFEKDVYLNKLPQIIADATIFPQKVLVKTPCSKILKSASIFSNIKGY